MRPAFRVYVVGELLVSSELPFQSQNEMDNSILFIIYDGLRLIFWMV